MQRRTLSRTTGLALLLAGVAALDAASLFDSQGDVGVTPRKGAFGYEAATGAYRVTGGGANVWAADDAFYFVWKRLSGDVTLTADVSFVGAGEHEHRKAMLMVRQDLTPGSAYADVAVHGDGLTSLQYRRTAGAETQEIRSEISGPTRVRIERRGNSFTMYAGEPGGELKPAGPQEVSLTDPVYVGIGVTSHNADVLETAVFRNISLQLAQAAAPTAQSPPEPRYRSKITIYDLGTRTARIIYEGDGIIEAPNWSRDGSYLLVNTGGRLYRLSVEGGELHEISLGDGGYSANNDHDLSADGKMLAFSASTPTARGSRVYVANADGTNIRQVTPETPSYFHGWSPDGRFVAYVAQRRGRNYEVYRAPVGGGPEEQLTFAGGYDDGPEYSPDGRWIYFNSNRSGQWEIWRIPAEGGGANDERAQRVTNDGPEDWFPHISPDGRRIVFFSFPEGTEGHNDRMPGVMLRMMPTPGEDARAADIENLLTFYGGQGTINVNSWAPDSTKFAFVQFERVE